MLGGAARRIAAHAARRLTSTASAPRATTPCATLLDATRFRTHRAATRWTAARAFASSPTTASAIADLRRPSAEAEGAGEKTTGASDAAVAPRRARVHAAAAHRPRALTVDELKAALAAGARATRRPLELWAGIVDWTTPGRRGARRRGAATARVAVRGEQHEAEAAAEDEQAQASEAAEAG